jgi:hypothetical protein
MAFNLVADLKGDLAGEHPGKVVALALYMEEALGAGDASRRPRVRLSHSRGAEQEIGRRDQPPAWRQVRLLPNAGNSLSWRA